MLVIAPSPDYATDVTLPSKYTSKINVFLCCGLFDDLPSGVTVDVVPSLGFVESSTSVLEITVYFTPLLLWLLWLRGVLISFLCPSDCCCSALGWYCVEERRERLIRRGVLPWICYTCCTVSTSACVPCLPSLYGPHASAYTPVAWQVPTGSLKFLFSKRGTQLGPLKFHHVVMMLFISPQMHNS